MTRLLVSAARAGIARTDGVHHPELLFKAKARRYRAAFALISLGYTTHASPTPPSPKAR